MGRRRAGGRRSGAGGNEGTPHRLLAPTVSWACILYVIIRRAPLNAFLLVEPEHADIQVVRVMGLHSRRMG